MRSTEWISSADIGTSTFIVYDAPLQSNETDREGEREREVERERERARARHFLLSVFPHGTSNARLFVPAAIAKRC